MDMLAIKNQAYKRHEKSKRGDGLKMTIDLKETVTNSNPKSGSRNWILIVAALVVVCMGAVCCLLIVGGILFFQFRSNTTSGPMPQILPQLIPNLDEPNIPPIPSIPPLPTLPPVPNLPPIPTLPPIPGLPELPTLEETSPTLEYGAVPLFGSISLQRGFSPDPFSVAAKAGGTVDTSALNLNCGFTTTVPTYTFKLSGGASETFLRIFFTASDGTDTTLVVYTPNQEWKCVDNSTYGSLVDPVMDFEMAPSGQYAIWAGTKLSDTFTIGKLFITQSKFTAP
jgi:hypothetical protein